MKKYIIIIILIALGIYCYIDFNKSTVTIEYVETIDDRDVNKTYEISTDIDPTVDETTVKVGHSDAEEVIILDTRYHKLVHPCSWKYIHTDGRLKRIDRAYIEHNDSIYNLSTKN